MRIELTNHAIERYIQRFWVPDGNTPEAALLAIAGRAKLLRDKSRQGHSYYQDAEVRLVCDVSDGRMVVITVLAKSDAPVQLEEYLPEALAEARAETLGRLTLEAERLKAEAERALKIAGNLQSAHARVLRAIRSLTE